MGPLSPSRYPIPQRTCKAWFLFLLSSGVTLLTTLDTLWIFQSKSQRLPGPKLILKKKSLRLTHIVYALYSKNLRVTLAVALLVVLQFVAGLGGGIHSVAYLPLTGECTFVGGDAARDFLFFASVPSHLTSRMN